MKSSIPSRKKGFTLVELLVVISIIAALAGLTFGVVMHQVDKAKMLESRQTCHSIAQAIENFYLDNNTFPVSRFPKEGQTITTGADDHFDLITILMNREKGSSRDKVNRSGKVYLSGTPTAEKTGGLYVMGNEAGFYDAWGEPYYVVLDVNGRDEINDPFKPEMPVFKKKALVYGTGPDGQGSAYDKKLRDAEVIQDNVYSWKDKTN